MRVPRKPAEPSDSPFQVKAVQHGARELVVTSDPPDKQYNLPPIVRIQPQPEQDEQVVANVREQWTQQGAHVRVMARERVQPEVVPHPVDEQAPVREVVLAVAAELKSVDAPMLATALNQIMDKVGL